MIYSLHLLARSEISLPLREPKFRRKIVELGAEVLLV